MQQNFIEEVEEQGKGRISEDTDKIKVLQV